MQQYRLYNTQHKRGFSYEMGLPSKGLVPFAVTSEGKVVYAPELGRKALDPKTQLRPYTREFSQQRRRECESALADIILHNDVYVRPAVQKVTKGLKDYLKAKRKAEPQQGAVDGVVDKHVQTYLYSPNYGYGRLASRKKIPGTQKERLKATLDALEKATLPTVLSIHDMFGRKVFVDLGPSDRPDDPKQSSQMKRFEHCGNTVRPDSLFKGAARGRIARIYEGPFTWEQTQENEEKRPEAKKRAAKVVADRIEKLRSESKPLPGALEQEQMVREETERQFTKMLREGHWVGPQPTKVSGVLPQQQEGSGAEVQLRRRGIDLYDPEYDTDFMKDVQERNLVFGAGPSGSTGTLLQAAALFGAITAGEHLKQYVLAIFVYLVGGGMHTGHEVLTIAKLAGCPYVEGRYVEVLPGSFTRSQDYALWRDEYFDVVRLGHLHGRYKNVS
jgi:hypothetical protein